MTAFPSIVRLTPLFLLAVLLATAAEPTKTTGIDTAGMNPAIAPGEDFYAYANGAWMTATEIPADRGNWGTGAALGEETNRRLVALIEAAAKNRAATPAERIAADFHTAYMDEAGIEARGLAPLQPLLSGIAAIKDKTALARTLGESLRADVDPLNATNFFTENLFGLWVAQGLDDPAHYTPYLLQGGLGMPDRAYYVTANPRMEGLRAKYRAHIATILRLGGLTDAEARAERVLALELKLAQVHSPREDSEDVLKANNPWRREDFAAKAPGLDWAAFFQSAGLAASPRFIVWHPGAVTAAAALVAGEPLAVWQDYLVYHALNKYSGVLPKAFAEEKFAFYENTLRGTPQQSARWKRALAAANAAVPDAVGQVYVAKYFPASSKARVQAMVANIVRAFDARISRLDWMAPATKEQARAKLKSLYVGVGYPDRWEDYTGLGIDPADAAGNILRAEKFTYRRRVAKLGGPVDATEWCMSPQEVNAVNMPMRNALDFPAAYLQAPFFDPAAPDAVNYAGIGTTIGHEISHSFDDQGSQFDARGLLRDWWTADDLAHFKASTAALVAQYSAYRPFPDLAVNGQLTLSENLVDLAGLAAAYDGYRAATAGQKEPAGAAFTNDQLFFIAFGQKWRSKFREASLRQRLITDGHAPGQYRALTVRNIDAWYVAFGVKPGQALHLEPAARVRAW
ncbi:MAG TPA: M13 family metallopeptidase [Lacunisphaera sp.]|nr:M13 family metallopeptidase [Lacunisphaera sp.]